MRGLSRGRERTETFIRKRNGGQTARLEESRAISSKFPLIFFPFLFSFRLARRSFFKEQLASSLSFASRKRGKKGRKERGRKRERKGNAGSAGNEIDGGVRRSPSIEARGYSKDEDRSPIERFLEQRRASLAFDYRERLADSFASERVHTSAWNRDGDTPVK